MHSQKTRQAPAIVLLVCCTLLAACTGREAALRVGLHDWIGYEVLLMGGKLGTYGTAHELVEFTAAYAIMDRLANGTLDAGCLTLDEAVRLADRGTALAVVAVLDRSVGGDAVIVRGDVAGLQDLAGRTIGVDSGGVGRFVYQLLQQQPGFPTGQVSVLDAKPDEHIRLWKERQVDAIVTFAGHYDEILEAGGQVLFSTRDAPSAIFDVLVIRQSALDENPGGVRDLVEGTLRAQQHLRTNPTDATYRLAGLPGNTLERTRRALTGIVIPDGDQQRAYFAADGPLNSAVLTIRSILEDGAEGRTEAGRELVFDARFLP
jgi:NitT/TauT family transport system substrate-binding protein